LSDTKSLSLKYEPFTLHPTPYTLHPTPYTLHHTPYTQHPIPDTPHPSPHTLHLPLTPCTLKFEPRILQHTVKKPERNTLTQVIAHLWEWVICHEHMSHCYEPSGQLKPDAFGNRKPPPASPRKDRTTQGRSSPTQGWRFAALHPSAPIHASPAV